MRFREPELRAFAEAVLGKVGAPAATARVVADSLLDADRRGVATHGLVRLASYCEQVRSGEIDPLAEPRIERESGATAWVDGRSAFGALTGTFAMDEAVARAERHGVALVAAKRCTHFGAAGYYALRAASRGFLGLAATNTPRVMAPFGGIEARLGNNPFAVAAPAPAGRPPFCLDMAQSAVSRGRVKLAELASEPVPEGWAIDPQGRPTTDAGAALDGALLPFGGYKGSGLAMAVEILTGVLAGAGISPELVNTSLTGPSASTGGASVGTTGSLYAAIDPGCFAGREAFLELLGRYADGLKATRPAPGLSEVLLPGELEARAAADAAARGIPLEPAAIEILEELGRAERVPFPDPC